MFVRFRKAKDGGVYARLVQSIREDNKIRQKTVMYLGKFYPGGWTFNFIAPVNCPETQRFVHNQGQLKKTKLALGRKPYRFRVLRDLIEKLDGKGFEDWQTFKYGELFGRLPERDSDGCLYDHERERLCEAMPEVTLRYAYD